LSALLSRHDATAQQIADSGEIPITKVYSVLSSLEKQGLVKCTLERPKKYRPLDPDSLMGSILGKRRSELETLEKTVSKKLDVLNEMYTQGESFQGQEKVWFANSFEAVWNIVYEQTSCSKKSIHASCDNWIWKKAFEDKKIGKMAFDATKRGVGFMLIFPSSLADDIKKVNFEWLSLLASNNGSCRILPDERIYSNIFIKDEEGVGIAFKDIKSGKIYNGIYISDKSVTEGILDYFRGLWYSAMPVENEIRREAQRALERMEQKKKSGKKRSIIKIQS